MECENSQHYEHRNRNTEKSKHRLGTDIKKNRFKTNASEQKKNVNESTFTYNICETKIIWNRHNVIFNRHKYDLI